MKIQLLSFVLLLGTTTAAAQAVVDWPGGRMAITSDGNAHDPDDIGGTPMSMALMDSAGLKDKLVHVDYANHLVGALDLR